MREPSGRSATATETDNDVLANGEIPPAVGPHFTRAIELIRGAFGVAPDYAPETLPLADAYLRTVASAVPKDRRSEIVEAVGCYFGEVARRQLAGRWALLCADQPQSWRIELVDCFLHFSPVGMVGEVVVGCESDEYDGSFATTDQQHDALAEMLANAPPITEEEYYSLCGRLEILVRAADWLITTNLAAGNKPHHFSPEDYRKHLSH